MRYQRARDDGLPSLLRVRAPQYVPFAIHVLLCCAITKVAKDLENDLVGDVQSRFARQVVRGCLDLDRRVLELCERLRVFHYANCGFVKAGR